MPVNWRDHIISTQDVLRGKPRIKGTRIPVSLVLGYLAAGRNADEIIKEFPDLTKEQIAACLDYARELAEFVEMGNLGQYHPAHHINLSRGTDKNRSIIFCPATTKIVSDGLRAQLWGRVSTVKLKAGGHVQGGT